MKECYLDKNGGLADLGCWVGRQRRNLGPEDVEPVLEDPPFTIQTLALLSFFVRIIKGNVSGEGLPESRSCYQISLQFFNAEKF